MEANRTRRLANFAFALALLGCDGKVSLSGGDAAVDASDPCETRVYADLDRDGHGNAGASYSVCDAPSFAVPLSDDCNDNCASCFPQNPEICDELDNDCDGRTDEGVSRSLYRDADGDTFGAGEPFALCVDREGYVTRDGDCNDGCVSCHPGGTEVCNGLDDDCDGTTDPVALCGENPGTSQYLKSDAIRPQAQFGYQLALSGNAQTLAVGEPFAPVVVEGVERSEAGRVSIFRKQNGRWSLAHVLTSPFVSLSDRFGSALALSNDGATLIVGVPSDDIDPNTAQGQDNNSLGYRDAGSVYVFALSDGLPQSYQRLNGSRIDSSSATFGQTVALSLDGSVLAVGAPMDEVFGDPSGRVYIFQRSSPTVPFALVTRLESSEPTTFLGTGSVIALSSDGTRVAMRNGTGFRSTVDVFAIDSSEGRFLQTLEAARTDAPTGFGASLAFGLHGANRMLAVGAATDDSCGAGNAGDPTCVGAIASGAVYLFREQNEVYARTALLRPPTPLADSEFGASVAFDPHAALLLVGAPNEEGSSRIVDGAVTPGSPDQGAAFLWSFQSGTFELEHYYKAPNGISGDRMGQSVNVVSAENRVWVVSGAVGEASSSSDVSERNNEAAMSGSVYVF